jgi:hypothetical protein
MMFCQERVTDECVQSIPLATVTQRVEARSNYCAGEIGTKRYMWSSDPILRHALISLECWEMRRYDQPVVLRMVNEAVWMS